ncbi:MAG: hypothetical protein WA150_07975, partial [Methylovirgula sp.]
PLSPAHRGQTHLIYFRADPEGPRAGFLTLAAAKREKSEIEHACPIQWSQLVAMGPVSGP